MTQADWTFSTDKPRGHALMPRQVASTIPALGDNGVDAAGFDAFVAVKFFSPFGRYTFYVTEFDQADTLFGYCVSPLGPDCDEWGYQSLSELANAVFNSVPAVERDIYLEQKTVAQALSDDGFASP